VGTTRRFRRSVRPDRPGCAESARGARSPSGLAASPTWRSAGRPRSGNGFIFVDGSGDAFDLAPRLREFLKEAGRSESGFGLHCNMLRASPFRGEMIVRKHAIPRSLCVAPALLVVGCEPGDFRPLLDIPIAPIGKTSPQCGKGECDDRINGCRVYSSSAARALPRFRLAPLVAQKRSKHSQAWERRALLPMLCCNRSIFLTAAQVHRRTRSRINDHPLFSPS
jgi:hypothetical protein